MKELKNEGAITAKIIMFHGGRAASSRDGKTMVTRHVREERTRFLNQKAQAYFHLRDQFQKGNIIIPDHPVLKDQLSKMKWTPSGSSNKIKILDPGEGKDDTAEKKSPDFADSLCYFTWDLEPRVMTVI